MPIVAGTPESILPRADSKNPNTTCKGLTSNGRPCRRSLASPKNGAKQGVLVVAPHIGKDKPTDIVADSTSYYCWQHKDQASTSIGNADLVPELRQRSSIDTLMEKLGVLNMKDDSRTPNKPKKSTTNGRVSLPQQMPATPTSPSSKLTDPFVNSPARTPLPPPRAVRKRQQQVHVSFFCCSRRAHHDETLPPARPMPKAPAPQQTASIPHSTANAQITNSNAASFLSQTLPRIVPASSGASSTYISATLSSTTRTALMAELIKPLTASDHEPGYIYLFWLTPKDVPRDAAQLASSLLQPHDKRPAIRDRRRTSDVLREYNNDVDDQHAETPNTIMLKIGRSSNVHRRMIQWSQQCGHHITLLRYYPHHKSLSSSPRSDVLPGSSLREKTARHESPSPTQKSPLIQRVERLIHIELAEKRIKRDCEGCGKEHREWFQIDATREGIQAVDDVVRRWIDWAQHQDNTIGTAFNNK